MRTRLPHLLAGLFLLIWTPLTEAAARSGPSDPPNAPYSARAAPAKLAGETNPLPRRPRHADSPSSRSDGPRAPGARVLLAQKSSRDETFSDVSTTAAQSAPAQSAPAQSSTAESATAEEGRSGADRIVGSGQVVDARTGNPISNAILSIPETSYRARSDRRGRFSLPPLPPGLYPLEVEAPGYARRTLQIVLEGSGILPLVALRRPGEETGIGRIIEIVEAAPAPPQPVERVLTLPELQKVPGSFNDAIRAVQNLPGVARSPLGLLIVRGTEPQDTGYYVDGIRIPQIFHFLGLHTVLNTDVLERVTFLPGNYGVRYGRTVGGVVDAATTEDIPVRYSGYLGVDLLSSVALARLPLSNTQGLYLSVRRSYGDLVLEKGIALAEEARGEPFNLGFIQAPRYWDYQALYNHKIGERSFLHALVFGSHDTVELITEPPASVRPEFRGPSQAGTRFSFDKALVSWRYRLEDFSSLLTVSFGPDINEFGFGGFSVLGRNDGLFMREDLTWDLRLLPDLHLRAGLDALFGRYSFDLTLPFDPTEGSLDPLEDPEPYTRSLSGFFYSPSPFAELEYTYNQRLTLVAGLRLDPFIFPGMYATTWLDPRFSASFRLKSPTELKASVGKYGQNPLPFAIDPEFGGNPELASQYALQYNLGVEHRFTPIITLEASAFYADLRRLVILSQDQQVNDGRPDFTNDGRGRNLGLELLLRHASYKGFFGWLSYTLLKSERLDGAPAPPESCEEGVAYVAEGACWVPFDFDQTHILNLVGSYELPRGFTIGGRFRFSTGLPYTTISNAYYDVDRNFYQALPSFDGARNNARIPPFHDLTLRVDKLFTLKRLKINAYVEVINVYNRANPESVDYNFDYSEEILVTGLPIFPNLGMKAEF